MSLFRDIIQCMIDEDPKTASIMRVFLLLLISAHIAWACGWFPGVPGFAMEADLIALREKVEQNITRSIESDLMEWQDKLCLLRENPTRGRDTEVRYKDQIRRLLRAHRRESGDNYTLDRCAQL